MLETMSRATADRGRPDRCCWIMSSSAGQLISDDTHPAPAAAADKQQEHGQRRCRT